MLDWISLRYVAVGLGAAGAWMAAVSFAPAAELKSWTEPAPSFVLRALNGPALDLGALRGKVVIVHFFATWCEPCREELPALQRLVARAGEERVAVVAVSVAEVELRVRRFFQSVPVGFPVLLDQDRRVTKAWNISVLPSTVILDSDLRPRLAVEGDFAWDQLGPDTLVDRLDQSRTAPNAPSIHQKGPRT
jgi:thiol-disulfide isomerase/thioredoxin